MEDSNRAVLGGQLTAVGQRLLPPGLQLVDVMNSPDVGGGARLQPARAPDHRGAGATTRLRVALRVPVGRPLPDLAAFIARCEEAGFDGIGIHDHPASGRDAYLALALAAQATRHVRLFPATSSPVVRHPLVLASLAHSLEEIAPGRTCLTIAPGFLSTRSVGQPRASVAAMRQAVSDLRRLLAGDTVTFGPTQSRLRNLSATPPPVYLLAAGPRMTELAGEVADGAFLMVGLHPAAIRAARHRLEQGARRAGRTLEGFPVVFVVTIGLGAGAALGARWVRRCERGGCGAGSPPASRSSPTRAPRTFDGSGMPGSSSGSRSIPPRFPTRKRTALPMLSASSARPSAVRSASSRRGKRRASSTCSYSPPMTWPGGTPCQRPRLRPLHA